MRDVIEIETKRLKLRRAAHERRDAHGAASAAIPASGAISRMTPLPYLRVAAEGWIMIAARRARRRDATSCSRVDLPAKA